jgi:hypothetical protein
MDQLGTYALVAALKEIAKKPISTLPAPNERWISLRSCIGAMQPLPAEPSAPAQLNPTQSEPAQPEPTQTARTFTTAPTRKGSSYIKAIDARHQTARRQK